MSTTGIPSGYIGAMTIFQGDLVVSGSFPSIASLPGTGFLARYNFGTNSWSAMGAGLVDGPNNAFGTSFTEMNGELYVAGFYQTASGVAGTRSLARWDGTQFLPVNTGWVLPNEGGPIHSVWACTTSSAFGGNKVYFGGYFEEVNGTAAGNVASWDGTTATPIVTSMPILTQPGTNPPQTINSNVFSMAVHDDGMGAGPQLYIGGRFDNVDGVAAKNIARWDGTTWTAVGTNLGHTVVTAEVDCMKVWNGELYIGGYNLRVNGTLAQVAKWDGTTWTAVGQNPTGRVWSLETFDDGSGEKLYAAGTATGLGRFFRLEGNTWVSVGGGVDAQSVKLLNHDGKLYVAGSFANAGGQPAGRLAIRTSCPPPCAADLDNGSGAGTPDGGVDINDLLYFLAGFEAGSTSVDLDNGSGVGTPDGGVDINDLLYFLIRFEAGC